MSTTHTGNIQPHLDYEEHDGTLNAKKVSLISSATIYAVVNTGAAGVQNSMVTLFPGPNFVGLVTVHHGTGLVTLAPSPNFVGLVTVANTVTVTQLTAANLNAVAFGYDGTTQRAINTGADGRIQGNVTVNNPISIAGNVTVSDSKGYIGLVTVGGIGTVTLADPKGFIGLVTTVPAFVSSYTSLSTVISALATIVIPPSGQKIFVRNLYISSLGRAEVSVWSVRSNATMNRIPWTSLSTTSGIDPYFGENGMQWGAADDGLTFALNGSATVSVMADVRFAA